MKEPVEAQKREKKTIYPLSPTTKKLSWRGDYLSYSVYTKFIYVHPSSSMRITVDVDIYSLV